MSDLSHRATSRLYPINDGPIPSIAGTQPPRQLSEAKLPLTAQPGASRQICRRRSISAPSARGFARGRLGRRAFYPRPRRAGMGLEGAGQAQHHRFVEASGTVPAGESAPVLRCLESNGFPFFRCRFSPLWTRPPSRQVQPDLHRWRRGLLTGRAVGLLAHVGAG